MFTPLFYTSKIPLLRNGDMGLQVKCTCNTNRSKLRDFGNHLSEYIYIYIYVCIV